MITMMHHHDSRDGRLAVLRHLQEVLGKEPGSLHARQGESGRPGTRTARCMCAYACLHARVCLLARMPVCVARGGGGGECRRRGVVRCIVSTWSLKRRVRACARCRLRVPACAHCHSGHCHSLPCFQQPTSRRRVTPWHLPGTLQLRGAMHPRMSHAPGGQQPASQPGRGPRGLGAAWGGSMTHLHVGVVVELVDEEDVGPHRLQDLGDHLGLPPWTHEAAGGGGGGMSPCAHVQTLQPPATC